MSFLSRIFRKPKPSPSSAPVPPVDPYGALARQLGPLARQVGEDTQRMGAALEAKRLKQALEGLGAAPAPRRKRL